MKKFFLFATVACLALASCDDVAEPFEIVTPGKGGTSGSSSSLPYTNANLKDWNLVTIKGAAWSLGSSYAKVTGHSGGADGTTTETESWLVSPAISLVTDSADVHITMDHVIRYVNATTAPLSNHTMWITTDYSNDVATATWTQLEYKPVESSTNDWTFYAADPIAVPSEFVGKEVYIAFKFICGASSTTWEINNLKVVAGKAVSVTPPTPDPAEHISIADFIAKADANTVYEITGVASKLNANYASLDLTEGDATVYVYKMVDASGAKVDFTALNIAEGDTVTVTGKYYKYEKDGNVKHELNPGTYVSHKKAGSVTPPTPGPVETISVAEFLSKADPNTTYRLVGTVKNIANATYGNFDLVQDGASIYIYGLLDKDGAAKNFASLGIKEGDELTLEGKYVDYNGKAEIKNAQYISHVSAGGGDPTPDPNPNPDPDPQPSGDNLIANGDFETWADGVPTNWKTASTAGNATIKQSTVAHSGKYSVEVAGTTSTNKRLGYKETNFAAGTYVVKFWVKAASDACSVRPGYATFNADGTINSSGYKYGDYVNDVTSAEWKEVTYEFTLESAQQICPVIMVSKNPGTSALIDDYSITKK